MPAISPAKLKLQTARLAEQYTQPGVFVRAMHTLLKSYADNTHRPGRSGTPSALIESYNVPQPVMRYLWVAMKPVVDQDPQRILELCDVLWTEPYLEHRLLACTLLGQVPVIQPEPIALRLERWTQTVPEPRLVGVVIEHGMARLRSEAPNTLLILIEAWLQSSNIYVQQLGLRALIPQVEDPGFQNLPAVFHLLTPFLRSIPPPLRPDLVDLLEKLALRSPSETAYTLRTALGSADNPDTAWLTRQVFPMFPVEIKNGLRQAIKKG